MITSVYISNERIQVLMGTPSKKHIDIKSCMFVSLAEGTIVNGVITNEVILKEAIEKLWSKYNLPKKDIYLVIDSGTILNKRAKVPVLPEKSIQAFVQEEFKDVEGFSNFLFDYTILNDGKNGDPEVLCNAVGKEFIATYVRTFEALGIKLKSIDIALSCEIKLVNLIKEVKDRDCIVIILDKNNMTSGLFINGTYSFSSRSRLLDQRGTKESEIEISRSMSSLIQFARSNKSRGNVTDIYICGLQEQEANICSSLTKAMGINVSILPACPEVTYQNDKNTAQFLLSDYTYAVGNLIRL